MVMPSSSSGPVSDAVAKARVGWSVTSTVWASKPTVDCTLLPHTSDNVSISDGSNRAGASVTPSTSLPASHTTRTVRDTFVLPFRIAGDTTMLALS